MKILGLWLLTVLTLVSTCKAHASYLLYVKGVPVIIDSDDAYVGNPPKKETVLSHFTSGSNEEFLLSNFTFIVLNTTQKIALVSESVGKQFVASSYVNIRTHSFIPTFVSGMGPIDGAACKKILAEIQPEALRQKHLSKFVGGLKPVLPGG